MHAFVTEIDNELIRMANQIPIFPHMADVIEKLSMVGSLGIVSATSRPVIFKVLQNYEIERFVRHIAGGDMPGAKSVKIKSIIQDNGSGLGKACMVGDTVSDIEQGKIAGGRRGDGAGARTCPPDTPADALTGASRRLTKLRAISAVPRQGAGSPAIRTPFA